MTLAKKKKAVKKVTKKKNIFSEASKNLKYKAAKKKVAKAIKKASTLYKIALKKAKLTNKKTK